MRLRSVVALSAVGVASQGIARLACNYTIGRIAGAGSLGAVSAMSAISFGLCVLGPSALGAAYTRFLPSISIGMGSGRAEEIRSGLLSFGSLLALAYAVCAALWAARAYGTADSVGTLLLTLGAACYAQVRPLTFIDHRAAEAAKWDLVVAVATIFSTFTAATAGLHGGVLLIPQAAGLLTYSAHFAGFPLSRPRLPYDMVEFVLLVCIGGIASAGMLQGLILVARWDAGDMGSGLMAAAVTMGTPVSFLGGAVVGALYPAISSKIALGDYGGARELSAKASRKMLTALLFPCILLIALRDWVFSAIWGVQFQDAAAFIPAILTAVLLTNAAAPHVTLLTTASRRGVYISTLCSVGGTLFGSALWIYALNRPGAQLQVIGLGYAVSMGATAVAAMIACRLKARELLVLVALPCVLVVLAASITVLDRLPSSLALAALLVVQFFALNGEVFISRRRQQHQG